jgi:hypothetical protein
MRAQFGLLSARALGSGSAAGIASALVAAAAVRQSGHRPFAAMNAVTHCLWPARAPRQESPSIRYTATGSGIHLGSAIFWGVMFEALSGTLPSRSAVLGAAAATAIVAYVIDYHVVPERFTPGYDVHMSGRALALTYVALGLGFAAIGLLRGRTSNKRACSRAFFS